MKTLFLIPIFCFSLVIGALSHGYAAEDVFAATAKASNTMAGIDDSAPAVAAPATPTAPALPVPAPHMATSTDHMVGIAYGVVGCIGLVLWFIHMKREDNIAYFGTHPMLS